MHKPVSLVLLDVKMWSSKSVSGERKARAAPPTNELDTLYKFSNVACLCVFRFDGNFNTNVSKTICCDRLSPTVNSRAFNPGRDLNSGLLVGHTHIQQMN